MPSYCHQAFVVYVWSAMLYGKNMTAIRQRSMVPKVRKQISSNKSSAWQLPIKMILIIPTVSSVSDLHGHDLQMNCASVNVSSRYRWSLVMGSVQVLRQPCPHVTTLDVIKLLFFRKDLAAKESLDGETVFYVIVLDKEVSGKLVYDCIILFP